MVKFISCVALVIFNYQISANRLVRYYYGEITLSHDQVYALSDSIINQKNSSNYLLALAYYQKGVIEMQKSNYFIAYEFHDFARSCLNKAEIDDEYLRSVLLADQGVILKRSGMPEYAATKLSEAVESAYKFSNEWGIGTKFNLAWTLEKVNPEKSLNLFFEILEEAKKAELNDRLSKVYMEIGLMFIRSEEYEEASVFFNKALSYTQNISQRGSIYQNYSHLYGEMGDLVKQEEWLRKSLALGDHKNRFLSLMDLGECLIKQGKMDEVSIYLREAESKYDDQPLHIDHLKVFDWLIEVTKEDKNKLHYSQTKGIEYQKIIDIQMKLSALMKKQAMKQLYLRLESQKKSNDTIGRLERLAISVVVLGITIFLIWRIWWNRLRRRLSRKLQELTTKWDDKYK